MEKLLGFASLNSPSKSICFLEKLYRAFDKVFNKCLGIRWKNWSVLHP